MVLLVHSVHGTTGSFSAWYYWFIQCMSSLVVHVMSLQITDINVDGLLQLPMISCLDLQNNDISQVPPQLGNVSTLR